jgi:glycogen synthase
MRVLMLSWEFTPHVVGGLGKHVVELVPALAAEGVEVHILTPRLRGGDPRESIPGDAGHGEFCVYRSDPPTISTLSSDFFSSAWQNNLRMYEKAQEVIEQHGPFDLIHVHDWLVAFVGEQIKRQHNIPLLTTIHATERGRGRGFLPGELPRAINNVEWWLTYESWRVICCSNYMSKEVREYFETPADKIDIIHNAVDTHRFDALEGVNLDKFRNNYAAADEQIIFFVGRIVEEKGIGVIIDAAPEILQKCPKIKFVIAGGGPQLDHYRALANERGLGQRFYFTGFISDDERDKLYKVADVAVFPSLYEPFGIVALEAMAAKTPVVVAETGGLIEVVTNHQTGIVVHPNNPGSLAWGVTHTLQNAEWSNFRVQHAYDVVCKEFNWRKVAVQTQAVYERVRKEYLDSAWAKLD